MAYLVMRRGPEPGRVYPFQEFNKTEIRLGRGNQNDIVIQDNDVSRDHILFQQAGEFYRLRDLKSSNGTFINGKRVDGRHWLLRARCTIELGESITLEYYPGEPDTQTRIPKRPMRALLVVEVAGEPEPTTHPLRDKNVKIGRSNTCDVTIVAPEVSRQHLELEPTPRGYLLRDLGSTNGTLLNEAPITEEELVNIGDIIRIGDQITIILTNEIPKSTGRKVTDSLVDTQELRNLGNVDKLRSTTEYDEPVAIVDDTQHTFPYRLGNQTDVDEAVLRESVLIAYDRDDWGQVVGLLVNRLMEADVPIWVEQYLPEGSNLWLTASHQARQSCWMLLIVVTPETLKRDVVRSHLSHFRNREKPVIALVYEPLERIPPSLKEVAETIHYNPALPDDTFRQVINAILRLQKNRHRHD